MRNQGQGDLCLETAAHVSKSSEQFWLGFKNFTRGRPRGLLPRPSNYFLIFLMTSGGSHHHSEDFENKVQNRPLHDHLKTTARPGGWEYRAEPIFPDTVQCHVGRKQEFINQLGR